MDEPIDVTCPCCFETVSVWFEADVEGVLVQDCEVCCNPWHVVVRRDPRGGPPSVDVSRAD